MNTMRGGTHRKKIMKLEIPQRTAVRNSIFVGRQTLKLFPVLLKDLHRYYFLCPPFGEIGSSSRISCVPSPLLFAYYLSTFGDNDKLFENQPLVTAMTEYTVLSFVCTIHAAKYSAVKLFLPALLWALDGNGCARANEKASHCYSVR